MVPFLITDNSPRDNARALSGFDEAASLRLSLNCLYRCPFGEVVLHTIKYVHQVERDVVGVYRCTLG